MPPQPALWPTHRKTWPWLLAAAALLTGGGLLIWTMRSAPTAGPAGYVADEAVFQQEYHKFYGVLMQAPNGARLFREAAGRVRERDYSAAIASLEETSREAALPVVFNDLAILFMERNDRVRASLAFREALARDNNDHLARSNLVNIGGFNLDQMGPVTAEEEPNNGLDHANLIAVGSNVQAEISGTTSDIDCFKFVAPPAPRDHLQIEVWARSMALQLAYRMYDGTCGCSTNNGPRSREERSPSA